MLEIIREIGKEFGSWLRSRPQLQPVFGVLAAACVVAMLWYVYCFAYWVFLSPRPRTYYVGGTLTTKGTVLPGAMLTFIPEAGPATVTKTGADGRYSARVVAGVHKVVVEARRIVRKGAPNQELSDDDIAQTSPSELEVLWLVPAAYTVSSQTPLRVTVEQKATTFNIQAE